MKLQKKELHCCGSLDCGAARQIFRLFPELRESEDEKSKKWILEYLYDGLRKSDEQFKDQFKHAIAWLEKQSEQKHVESEQTCYHNDGLYYAIDILEKTLGKVEGYQSDDGMIEHQTAIETVNTLYHKKPAVWGEEDEKMLTSIIDDTVQEVVLDSKQITWLKSLKPQNRWKH